MPYDDSLLKAYLAHAETVAVHRNRNDNAFWWAYEAVEDLRRADPEGLWAFLVAAIARTESDAILAYLAAGPLEDLIVYRGPDFIERIEVQAGLDARFRRALVGVWGRNSMDRDVAVRLDVLVANEPPL